jgi:hypothetical protein
VVVVLITSVPEKVQEHRSGLRHSEEELPGGRNGTFRQKNTHSMDMVNFLSTVDTFLNNCEIKAGTNQRSSPEVLHITQQSSRL